MIKILNWNSNGANKTKLKIIKKYILLFKLDVVILTESHKGFSDFIYSKKKKRKKKILPGWNLIENTKMTKNGISIFHRDTLNIKKVRKSKNNRLISMDIIKNHTTMKLVAIYAPTTNKEKETFWKESYLIHEIQQSDLVIGDFNFDPDRKINGITLNTMDFIKNMLKDFNDVGAQFESHKTYRDISRIDHCFLRNNSFCAEKLVILQDITGKNDHKPMLIKLKDGLIKKDNNWRFKSFMILNEEDKHSLHNYINTAKGEDWTSLKEELTDKCKQLENMIIKKRKKHYYQAKHYLKKFPRGKKKGKWILKIKTFEKMRKKAQRLWTRTKKTISKELPSSWLTSKVKKKENNRKIKSIQNVNGNITFDNKEIADTFKEFYKNLYKKKDIDTDVLEELMSSWTPPNLNFGFMEKDFKMSELKEAINSLKNKKAPGEDGITNIIYKNMEEDKLMILLKQMNKFLNEGYVDDNWKKGIITLIPKPGDPNQPGNYRPITLLNTDYKIMCKIITNRLYKIIKNLIPNFQIGFMPDRIIYDNVICLDLAIKEKFKILILDFKKAYDSISHDALIFILVKLGFQKRFTNLIKGMLVNSTGKLIVNNELSESFKIDCGVKQGDPLSPLLFTLIVELISRNKICKEDFIPKINDFHLPILMYADDTVLFSKTEEGLYKWLKVLDKLKKATGLELNLNKTNIMNNKDILGIKRIDKIRYLGFNFNSEGLIYDYDDEVNTTVEKLKVNRRKSWSIFQKVSVMRTYFESRLTFKGFLMAEANDKLKKEKLNFLWNNGNGRITLVNNIRTNLPWYMGGLGLTRDDIRASALKSRMGERILMDKEMKINNILNINEEERIKIIHDGKVDLKYDLLNNLIDAWRKNTPNAKKQHTVQEIQNHLKANHFKQNAALYKNKLITKRQSQFKKKLKIKIQGIFSNVKRIENLNSRFFMWRYFQGGLPFKHKDFCKICFKEKTSHEHIFFRCESSKEEWLKASRLVNLIYNIVPRRWHKNYVKIDPIWSENLIWQEFSLYKENYLIKEIITVTMRTIWLKFNGSTRGFIEILEESLEDKIQSMKMTKNKIERSFKKEMIEKKWRVPYLWDHDEVSFVLNRQTSLYIEDGSHSSFINKLLKERVKRKNNLCSMYFNVTNLGLSKSNPIYLD